MFSFTSGVFCDTDLVNKILKNYDNNYETNSKPAATSWFFFYRRADTGFCFISKFQTNNITMFYVIENSHSDR